MEITFNKPVKGIGSVVSYTANTMQELEKRKALHEKQGIRSVQILENKATYPQFNWVKVA